MGRGEIRRRGERWGMVGARGKGEAVNGRCGRFEVAERRREERGRESAEWGRGW